MLSGNRDRIVERYLNGSMSTSEEQEFLCRVERDPELRHALSVEQAIDRTLRKDRNALPDEDREARTYVLTMLGRLPAMEQQAITGAAILGSKWWKGALATLVAGGLALGTIYLTHPDAAPASGAPPAVAPAAKVQASPPAPRIEPAQTEADVNMKQLTVSSTPLPRAGTSTITRSLPADTLAAAPAAEHVTEPAGDSLPARTASPPIVITRDTMRVEVNINLQKMK
jgi:hypothetical protein